MDTNTLLILILLFLVLVLLVAIVGLVIFVFKRSESKSLPTQQVINDPAKEFKKIFDDNRNKDKKVLGLCNMCEKELYEGDHFEVDHLHLCKEHFDHYTSNEWISITNQKTTAQTPEAGIYIYNFKQELWDKDKEACFIQCEYKIDVTTDQIETYVLLHVLKDRAAELKARLERNGIK